MAFPVKSGTDDARVRRSVTADKGSLEERIVQLQAAQRRQRERWAEANRCEDCGSDESVEGAVDISTGLYRLSCQKCRNERSGLNA